MEKITGNELITPCHLRKIGEGQDDTIVATPTDLANRSIGHYILSNKGLTIRQQFAAMAMQGILSSFDPGNNPFISPVDCAVQSVKCADALINELNK